jgi:acetyl-CoA acetyltransferase
MPMPRADGMSERDRAAVDVELVDVRLEHAQPRQHDGRERLVHFIKIDVAELNEAFASQTLACLAGWPDLDPDKLNVNGGAIAIGHPLGARGARILGTLAHELRRRGGGYGVASICIGVGQGLAVVLEA